ncbi:hypothetical protein EHO59_06355 [Leptospira semungkisensis]|uniref:Uncharacterized protein n=1 Tax=Leptospira semungkisensis TaxID=2484985 RepID=A0A4V3JCX2_9LEPT|nr:hypothetical protein [Leptospira semungkisensis]TGK07719.1 hypothetical protein EHO59_06355 [Leptospira semungkisensis]
MKSFVIIAFLWIALGSCSNDSACDRGCNNNLSVCLLLTKGSKSPLGVYYICETFHTSCVNACYYSGTNVRTYRGGSSRGGSGGGSGGDGGESGGHGGGGHGEGTIF